MRIVFHVGMGKTGTSSIQRALQANADRLAEQHTQYLGLWFGMIDPRFVSYDGFAAFTKEAPAAQARHAKTFADWMRAQSAQNGTDLFIHSNEGLFGQVGNLRHFFEALAEEMDVSFIAYMRPVRDWLPSAFTQWNIRHKQHKGPIQPFSRRGRTLVSQYRPAVEWKRAFAERFELRPFQKGTDVVADFAEALDLDLTVPDKRSLERSEPAEIVLRALFNDRYEPPILPQRFNGIVLANQKPVTSIERMAQLCFEYDGLEEIVEENRDLFESIETELGIDVLAPSSLAPKPDPSELRDRIVDHLVEIVLQQSLRLKRMERLLDEKE